MVFYQIRHFNIVTWIWSKQLEILFLHTAVRGQRSGRTDGTATVKSRINANRRLSPLKNNRNKLMPFLKWRIKTHTHTHQWSLPERCLPPAAAAGVVRAPTNSSQRSVTWRSLFPVTSFTNLNKKEQSSKQSHIFHISVRCSLNQFCGITAAHALLLLMIL